MQADADEIELVNTPELKLWVKWGSILNPNYLVVKGKYIFTGNIKPEDFTSLLNEKRIQWDHNIIQYEILKRPQPNMQIVHYITEAPSAFAFPTEYIEKHIRFVHDSVHYAYCSSVPHNAFPTKEGCTRGTTVFAGSVLKREGGVTAYSSFSQVQLNVWAWIKVGEQGWSC
eukprot:TRINITY_DN15032_c0_g1_i2.p1 TRINITY_DN15032_c0_g1~~TRINITY_DN15032_c0_g1_i2.p1  ORF type:complete len:171 (+),score=16.10 TRINITY_DN15032_c0_g1_i2:270-782(+)